jgi:hypothetical protein
MQYFAPVLSGVIAGFICKAYFAAKMQNKIKDCQNDLMKSQEKVFELQTLNDNLENRLRELERYFSKDSISMN